MTADQLIAELQKLARDDIAITSQRFFKTAAGQYGEGDQFIGVRVPAMRLVCKTFRDLPLGEVQKLLDSPIHEHRLAAAIILSYAYPKAADDQKEKIYDLYLKNVYKGRINNWDIIDVTTEHVIGAHLKERDRKVLYDLAKSDNVWQKRVAIISTFGFIKKGDPTTTFDIADILLHDSHDLIQKAVGWMLREVGKRVDERLLTNYLDKHAHEMPRTMLRYAIERLPGDQRALYMGQKTRRGAE